MPGVDFRSRHSSANEHSSASDTKGDLGKAGNSALTFFGWTTKIY